MSESNPPESPPKEKRKPQVALRWGWLCAWGSFLAITFGDLLGHRWPFQLVTPFVPQWAAVGLLGAILLLVARRRGRRTWRQDRVSFLAAILAMGYASAIAMGWVPFRMVPPAAGVAAGDANLGTLKVLVANVHSSNTNHRALLDLVAAEEPDVVLLLELNSAWVNDLAPLGTTYSTHAAIPDDAGNFGMGFWSRYSAGSVFTLIKPEEPGSLHDVPQLDAVIRMPRSDGVTVAVRFIGLHPLPPMNPGNAAARDAVLRGAAEQINRNMPAIIAGDFNATRYCRITRDLARDATLRDAAAPIRFSWPNAWSSFAMGIRIDHTLISDHFRVVDVHKGADIGSDHFPIVTTLQLVRESVAR